MAGKKIIQYQKANGIQEEREIVGNIRGKGTDFDC